MSKLLRITGKVIAGTFDLMVKYTIASCIGGAIAVLAALILPYDVDGAATANLIGFVLFIRSL